MVLQFGPHQLHKIGARTYSRHAQSTQKQFMNGNFTVCKTNRLFSSLALDQAHEHHNAAVNSDGGAVGLTQSPEALRHWMVAGPELVRVTSEFEASIGEKTQQASGYQPP